VNDPYIAINHIVNVLVNYLLLQADTILAKFRVKISSKLGAIGVAAFREKFPVLNKLYNKDTDEKPIKIELNLYYRYLVDILQVVENVTKKEVMFCFIHLHYSDGFFGFIQYLLQFSSKKSWVIIANYHSESDPEENIISYFKSLQNVDIKSIEFLPLTNNDVLVYLQSIMYKNSGKLAEFAEILNYKAGGSPVYVSKFLLQLLKSNILTCDAQKGSWSFELEAAEKNIEFSEAGLYNIMTTLNELTMLERKILNIAGNV
jgi:predicted ATPase